MTVKKDSGQWLVNTRPDGANGKRVRKHNYNHAVRALGARTFGRNGKVKPVTEWGLCGHRERR
ncbi:hypothetical protein [Alkalimarinus coralli]|uniref:hypothetical protein n=1 Tax=Alkalimarinus coralli TaxID=2935863 RepID=UPI00202B1619|nr:hypothetical protein [Alkalimarinus coralli]